MTLLVDVTACGHEGSWHFPGSRTFSTWTRDRPWCGQGGLCVVRTEDSLSHDLLFASIARALHAVHGDGRQLDVRLLACGRDRGGPLGTILSSLELDPHSSFRVARDNIRIKLLDRHAVFVLYEQEPLDIRDWDRFVQNMEDLRKATTLVGLCAIVLDSRSIVQAQPTCDFISGQLVHQVMDLADGMSDSSMWEAYLHQRACWDAGGSLHRAAMISLSLSEATPFDDDQVEMLLQSYACEEMTSSGNVELLEQYLKPSLNKRSLTDELKALHLLWRPPRANGLSIVPWAARALLARGQAAHHVWALRHSLVCAPLASEILSSCLHVEAQIRTELHGKGVMRAPGEDTQDNFEAFSNAGSETTVYPTAHPSRPCQAQDIWAFCSFGEILSLSPRMPTETFNAYRKISFLRNSIAHGHYVCWTHVKQAAKATSLFVNR